MGDYDDLAKAFYFILGATLLAGCFIGFVIRWLI